MKGPLHCKPQATDSKSSLNEDAQSEGYDSTMEKQDQLFYNTGLLPKQTQDAVSYVYAAAPLLIS